MHIDNSDERQKLLIRRRLGEALPGAAVLDCFSGTGQMAAQAWAGRRVVRIDKKRLPGIDHVGDNEKLAPKLAASGAFGILDLDAYSNPWRLMQLVAQALPPGRYGFAITCGMRRTLAHGRDRWACDLIGIPRCGANLLAFYDEVVSLALHRTGMAIESAEWLAPSKRGLTVRYFGVLARKTVAVKPDPEP
ncbi:MAG: hypothetical protein WAT39_01915 [Planctomycetota bacterium]